MVRHKWSGNERRGKSYGSNEKKYEHLCLWCGKAFKAARPEAKTCCNAHRLALGRYVKRNGHPPMFPFGIPPGACVGRVMKCG